ncbi:MAG: hypothetical protein NTU41_01150, partial [Chloroflexi bacterium]|nr:hypothetical protein [Chloroflexota bacterium]
AHFLENVGTYKERNTKSPKIKGIGVILTKTDRVQHLPNMCMDPTTSQIDDFMKVNLLQTYAHLGALMSDLKFPKRFFYHWLRPVADEKDDGPGRFEIDQNRFMVLYPDQQYDALIKWMRDIS